MRFIVTGTPRSATKYAARLLTACGAPCVHERDLLPNVPVVNALRWFNRNNDGESSWAAWTFLPLFDEPVPVLHTIRDPWLVIDSLVNRNHILEVLPDGRTNALDALRDMIWHYCPEAWAWNSKVDRAAQFVLSWHAAIKAAVPDEWRYTFCVERLDVQAVRIMLRHVGCVPDNDKIGTALADPRFKVNAGFNVTNLDQISNPHVRDYLVDYAKRNKIDTIHAKRIDEATDRTSPAELAARMSPSLRDEINDYAGRYGYAEACIPELVPA